MINLAVISKKDLIKYILKFTVFILVLIVLSNILKESKGKFTFNILNEKEVIGLLDEAIPGISQLNTKEDNKKIYENINPLELVLKMELGAIDTTIQKNKKEAEITKTEEIASSIIEENKEQVEHAKTRIKYTGSTK